MTSVAKSPVKLTLGDFTVEFLGVEYPDYFQGYGLGPSSEYTGCCNGIGSTEAEALEDCLEMMAQSGGFDLDSEAENRIREEYGPANDKVDALEQVGCMALDEYPDHKCPECGEDISDVTFGDNCANCGYVFDYPEHVPYFHIGIKWNIREEQRLERIRKIRGIQPLSYSNYCAVETDTDGYSTVWGHERRADGSASYGDFKDEDWPESAEAYFGSLCEDIQETEERYFYVPYASGSDYSGCLAEKANAKCIEDEFDEHEWIHPVYGGHGTYAVAVGLTGLLGCDEDVFDDFCSILEGLENYPVIDDEAHSELEMEDTDEQWELWCKDDFVRTLEKEFEDEVEFNWPDDSKLRAFFEEKREEANEYWFDEGMGSGMYIRLDKIIESVILDDLIKWAVRYEVSYNNTGEETEEFYSEADALERVTILRENGITGASYKVLMPESDDTFPLQDAIEMGLTTDQIAQARKEGVTDLLGLRRIEKNSRTNG